MKHIRHFVYKLKNFWKLGKIGWNDVGWDFHYSFPKLVAYKLRQSLNEIDWEMFGIPAQNKDYPLYCVDADKWAKPYCRIALKLIERFIEDDNCMRELNLAMEIIKTRSGYWWE
jgi:hypothetical protein